MSTDDADIFLAKDKEKTWRDRLADLAFKLVLRAAVKALFGAKVHGLEHYKSMKDKPLIVAPNHVSMIDGILLGALLPGNPAFAIDTGQYEKWSSRWWTGWLLKRIDMLPVDPDKPHSVRTMTKIAKSGRPVVIFVEGMLTRTGGPMPASAGAATIAENAGAPFLPVYLEGMENLAFGKNEHMKDFPRRWFPRLTLTLNEPRTLDIDPALKGRAKRAAQEVQLDKMMQEVPLSSLRDGVTLMSKLHDTARNFGHKYPIIDYFADAQAKSWSTMTYGNILTAAYALGGKLAKETEAYSVDKDGKIHGAVGVILPNGHSTAATIPALLSHGRIPAMLNPKENIDKLLSSAETAGIKTIVTSRKLVEAAGIEREIETLRGDGARKIIYLEDIKDNISKFDGLKAKLQARGWWPKPRAQKRMKANDPAAILFTSGSEGKPKGVVLSSRNFLANILQIRSVESFTPADRMFNAMPQFHAFGLTGGFFMPLLNGLRSLQYPTPLDSKNIPRVVHYYHATHMFGTNKFLNLYARSAKNSHFRNIKNIMAGGERLHDDTRETYRDRFGIIINEAYGMTEACPGITTNVKGANKVGTVGRLLPGIQARFRKFAGYKDGVLQVRGPNIMLGYLKADNPGVLQPLEDGWLDTGDVFEMDEDGFGKIVGRAKRIVIIGGENVELDDIEKVASRASSKPEFEHAAFARHDERKGEAVVLFTTDPEMSREKMIAALKAEARRKLGPDANEQDVSVNTLGLPESANIVHVKEMPHLGIGKIDYPALERLFNARANGQTGSAPAHAATMREAAPAPAL